MSSIEFESMVLSHTKPLKYFAQSLTANRDSAQDLYQETMLKAFRYRDKYEDRNNLLGWLYTIMRNIFINDYRKTKRANTLIDSTDDLYHINSSGKGVLNGPETEFAYNEIQNRIGELPNDLRQPVEMHFGGYKYAEIAEDMNLPLGTVKSRLFLARKKLMGVLTGY